VYVGGAVLGAGASFGAKWMGVNSEVASELKMEPASRSLISVD